MDTPIQAGGEHERPRPGVTFDTLLGSVLDYADDEFIRTRSAALDDERHDEAADNTPEYNLIRIETIALTRRLLCSSDLKRADSFTPRELHIFNAFYMKLLIRYAKSHKPSDRVDLYIDMLNGDSDKALRVRYPLIDNFQAVCLEMTQLLQNIILGGGIEDAPEEIVLFEDIDDLSQHLDAHYVHKIDKVAADTIIHGLGSHDRVVRQTAESRIDNTRALLAALTQDSYKAFRRIRNMRPALIARRNIALLNALNDAQAVNYGDHDLWLRRFLEGTLDIDSLTTIFDDQHQDYSFMNMDSKLQRMVEAIMRADSEPFSGTR